MRANDSAANAAQAEFWNEAAGLRWASLSERIDTLFAPITAALLERAEPVTGESALDIGCGTGETTLALAERIGPHGRIVGVDISKPMLAVADRRSRDRRVPNVEFVCADAATYIFTQPFRLALSRFGVMFFDDPVSAFTNIRRALSPDGRLSFACWRSLAENDWFAVPLQAAKPHAPTQPESNPNDPGPLAFADPERVRHILTASDFSDVAIEALDVDLVLGRRDTAVDLLMQIGPTSRLVDPAQTTADVRAAVARAIDAALAHHESADGVVALSGAVWLVNAGR